MNNKLAALYLLFVAALWGLTFPLIEKSMEMQDPFIFVSCRFTLAALPILPFFLKKLTKKFLIIGLILGLMHSGAFIFQTIGLQTLNASRAAFLTGIYVLMIPFLSPFLKMGFPSYKDIVSGCICCFGIYVLTGCDLGQVSVGDYWILACDFFIAASIIYIGKQSKNNLDPYMLAYTQIVMTALFSWVPTLLFSDYNFNAMLNMDAMASLIICSFFATILAIMLQSKYQKYVSIQNTALIFSLEPVFAAIFDQIITGVAPTLYTISGGGIILISILYLELSKPKKELELTQLAD